MVEKSATEQIAELKITLFDINREIARLSEIGRQLGAKLVELETAEANKKETKDE